MPSALEIVEENAASSQPLSTGKGERLVYIDALRGIAALWVMLHHFIFGNLNETAVNGPVAEVVRFIAAYGYLGVEIFFVLSGCVISYSVRNALITPRFFGAFALRRSVRLDPPYWFVICAAYLVDRLTSGPVGARAGMPEWLVLLFNFTYLNQMVGSPTIVAVGWTLCQEVQFYLVFILLLGVSQRIGRLLRSDKYARLLIFLPLAVYSIVIALGLLPTPWPRSFFELWHMFFAGVCVTWAIYGGIPKVWSWVFVLSLACLGGVTNDARMIVAAIAACSILIVAARGKLTTFLGNRVLQYFGRISYSLYLIHPLVGNRFLRLALRWTGPSPSLAAATLLFTVATLASVLAAHLMYRFIEKPSLLLAKRIELRKKPSLETVC